MDWFDKLTLDERDRREAFKKQFDPDHKPFKRLPLSTARNISVHRTGFVGAVKVTIRGRFGVTYCGSAVEPVPVAETPMIDGPAPSLVRPNLDSRSPKGRRLLHRRENPSAPIPRECDLPQLRE
jgi:hypothetical protein